MKYAIVSLAVIGILITVAAPSYASDWDKAGKALAIIEGARILTGGNVDIIGNVAGINRGDRSSNRDNNRSYNYAEHRPCPSRHECAPRYIWVKKYIPEHEEYSKKYGRMIIVEGHYIRYKVGDDGYR